MRVPPPNFRLTTVPQIYDAISIIFRGREKQAYQSQYDVGVCVRSVEAGRVAFKDVPLQGNAMEYCRSVKKAVDQVHKDFYDSSGEYTSRGMIGDVCSDIYQLIEDQQSGKLKEIDMNEAGDVLTREMLELIKLIPRPVGDAVGAVVKAKTEAASGTRYYVRIELLEDPDNDFAVYGQIFNSSKYQVKLLDNRLDLTDDT